MGKFNPPACFDFSKPQEWPDWKSRWERYHAASELERKPGRTQVSSLIYAMGADAEVIFRSFVFDAAKGEDENDHDCVLVKFDSHFVPKLNVIYERAKFHRRTQKAGENVSTYIRALYDLASTCLFNDKETRIRDQLVIGISDSKTSEKLQLQDDLELADAIDICRAREQIKDQMAKLSSDASLDSVRKPRTSRGPEQRPSGRPEEKPGRPRRKNDRCCDACHRCRCHDDDDEDEDASEEDGEICNNCGLEHRTPGRCPATGKRCMRCDKKGHFASVCPNKRGGRKQAKETDEVYQNSDSHDVYEPSFYLG